MSHRNNGKLLPVPKRKSNKIILFDIDGTLIGDHVGRLNKLKKVIIKLEKNGWLFGLNTNRPYSEAKDIYRALSLNGPVISENGSYYLISLRAKAIALAQADPNLRHKIVVFLKHNKKLTGYRIIVSSDKTILSNEKISNLIFITASRRYTASIYVRRSGQTSRKETYQVLNLIKRDLPKTKVEIVPENGKIIISNSKVDKMSTLSYLAKKYFKTSQVIMISNDEEITKDFAKIYFCGPKESSSRYKEKCSYVSPENGVAGILDIINNCL